MNLRFSKTLYLLLTINSLKSNKPCTYTKYKPVNSAPVISTHSIITLKISIHPPHTTPTSTFLSSLGFKSLLQQQWEINPFEPLLLLYLDRLSHPLIVCGLPSAAWETADAPRPPGRYVSHLRSMTPRTPATGKKQSLFSLYSRPSCLPSLVQNITIKG